jgi:glutamate-1-semialdehyde 2,1-aminomutase
MEFKKSDALREKAHRLIPGGAHTYAKGDDQFPVAAPGFIARGKGCHVWDVDGNEFIEYGMGLRSVALGHGHPRIAEAIHRQALLGVNFTRPAALEVECAEAFLNVLGGDMIKFAKNGSDITTAAVKLARAHTGRDLVAICAEHPFFSTDDWFIGATPMDAGIPEAVRALTVKFHYNDAQSVEDLFLRHPGKIACLICEAATTVGPQNGFLQSVQESCRKHGAVFILDEMITGFRWHLKGAAHVFGIDPDLRCFGKAMANGFALSALVGRRELMELGGLKHAGERVFLLSTTHGAEGSALAAGMEALKIYQEEDAIGNMARQGERLKAGAARAIAAQGLEGKFEVMGHPANLVFATKDAQGAPSQVFRALFMQEMIQRGILGPSFVVSHAHGDADVDKTVAALGETLAIYAKALREGPEKYLRGRPVKPVFRKRND